ncbi:hypothetical protein BIW11_13903 [Tropilaelaps mercedesae]|uniref:SP-RING-type domain-containing protein n=1 Tax=Tropilaelaps mercedesae TaxID=418985 RepID=A0A1V9X087_9ACAR|nr:hypothetical protein BIW11_13903 [Tropilaelaps mercedesae]
MITFQLLLFQDKMEPKVPDYLPYLRLFGPICRSTPLRDARTTMTIDIPNKYREEFSGKLIIDLRLLVKIDVPPSRTHEEDQPVPGEIVARRRTHSVMMEARLHPKWAKVKGCFFNEIPLDLTEMVLEQASPKGNLKCQIELELHILEDSRATGVAEVFLSRHVDTYVLRRSVLAGEAFERNVVERKQSSLAGSGIDSWIVSLKCPLLAIRITTPVRFDQCQHLECFDLDAFIAMEMKRPKGRCPVCNRLVEIRTLGLCAFTKKMLKDHPDCESYQISENSIRPISNEEKVRLRNRKIPMTFGILRPLWRPAETESKGLLTSRALLKRQELNISDRWTSVSLERFQKEAIASRKRKRILMEGAQQTPWDSAMEKRERRESTHSGNQVTLQASENDYVVILDD